MFESPIKRKILIPLIVVFALFIVAFIASSYFFEVQKKQGDVADKIDGVSSLFRQQVEHDVSKMDALIATILKNDDIVSAFVAQDRDRLLAVSLPIFKDLTDRHRITHFYFTNPGRVNFVRIHQPDRRGDRIDRFTTLEAERNRAPSSGIELGPLGTFTLRVVAPILKDGRLLGYIELGEEIEHIISGIVTHLDTQIFVLIYKDFIKQPVWETGMKRLRRDSNWDRFQNVVMINEPKSAIPPEIIGFLDHQKQERHVLVEAIFDRNTFYDVAFLPLYDASNTEIGDFVAVFNSTESNVAFLQNTVFTSLLALLSGGVLFWVFYRQAENTEQLIEKSQQEITQAQKIKSMNSLAGGLTHELNNLLLPISALTGMVLKKLPDDHSERGKLEKVAEAADRAKNIIAQVLAFSRTAEPKQENVDIATVVLDALKLIRNTSPATIKVEEQVVLNTGTVHADAAQIAITLMNLTSNALDAMDGKTGEMTISLMRVKVDSQLAKSIPGLESGNYAMLSVSDTGYGIDKETLERLYDPFFTTKNVGEGTGLGLSAVHGIVQSHGGAINVISKLGKGTTFDIYLPLVENG